MFGTVRAFRLEIESVGRGGLQDARSRRLTLVCALHKGASYHGLRKELYPCRRTRAQCYPRRLEIRKLLRTVALPAGWRTSPRRIRSSCWDRGDSSYVQERLPTRDLDQQGPTGSGGGN